MRILWGLVCAAVCTSGAAGEAPFICTSNPAIQPTSRPVVEDLATGKLPIPDYQATAIACTRSGPFRQGDSSAPASSWLEGERARYTAVLSKQPADILVVPFQIQGFGLDRIERALMTADLAYAIGDTGSLKVADPFITALALGEGSRRLDALTVERLAREIGARKVLWAYIGHDFKHTFTLTLNLQELAPGSGAKSWQRDWRSIPFTNEKTPAYVFHEMLPAVLQELPLGLNPQRNSSARLAQTPKKIDAAPLASVANGKSGSDIATMNLLAALSPAAADLTRERLFERALLTSIRANTSKPEQRFFEAYALLNLHRRPVALSRIDGASGASFEALRALLDGNLPSARAATSNVQNPLEQLLLQFELRDLEYEYEAEELTEVTAVARLFTDRAVFDWAPLLMTRLEDENRAFVPDAGSLKETLDQAFPRDEFSLDSLTRGTVVMGGKELDEVDIDIANTRHARQIATRLKLPACCRTSDLQPGQWDLLWMLEGLAHERINRDLGHGIFILGTEATALEDMRRYEPLFKGQPRMTVLRAYAANAIAEQRPDDERANWQAMSNQDARAVLGWSPGQNEIAEWAAGALGIDAPASKLWVDIYGYDFPRRSIWPAVFVNDSMQGAEPLLIAMLGEALVFSTSNINPLLALQGESGDHARATLGTRFAGNPRRPQPPALAHDRLAAAVAAAKLDPEKNRDLGYELLLNSDRPYREALAAFLAYPSFQKRTARSPVALANEAFEVGSRFFWLGQVEMATPLLQIAADLDTGSDSSMASQQRLSLFKGDYLGAAQMALARSQRYSSEYAQRDYLSLLHAFGKHDAAWKAFGQLRAAQREPAPWASAIVGHRMQKLDESAVRAWLKTPEILDTKHTAELFASYYALLWSSTDRVPPADLGALVAELEGKPVATIDVSGVSRPHPMGGFTIVQPSFVPSGADKGPKLAEGTPVKSERFYFAGAYSAVVRGQYAKAVDEFEALARLYPIDGMSMPYFAYAAAKTGDTLQLEKYVAKQGLRSQYNFDVLLSRAFFAAARGDVDESYRFLTGAFRHKPYLGERPVDVDYQFAQACEWLYQDTKDPRFAATLLDWAGNYQVIQPTSAWSYAMQYQYETNPEARTRALAMTLYLDPLSGRIRKASKTEVKKAQAWLASHNPFAITPEQDKAAPRAAVAL